MDFFLFSKLGRNLLVLALISFFVVYPVGMSFASPLKCTAGCCLSGASQDNADQKSGPKISQSSLPCPCSPAPKTLDKPSGCADLESMVFACCTTQGKGQKASGPAAITSESVVLENTNTDRLFLVKAYDTGPPASIILTTSSFLI